MCNIYCGMLLFTQFNKSAYKGFTFHTYLPTYHNSVVTAKLEILCLELADLKKNTHHLIIILFLTYLPTFLYTYMPSCQRWTYLLTIYKCIVIFIIFRLFPSLARWKPYCLHKLGEILWTWTSSDLWQHSSHSNHVAQGSMEDGGLQSTACLSLPHEKKWVYFFRYYIFMFFVYHSYIMEYYLFIWQYKKQYKNVYNSLLFSVIEWYQYR